MKLRLPSAEMPRPIRNKKNQNEILEQLLPALITIQQTRQKILQILTSMEANQAKKPTSIVELMIDNPVQGVMPATNVDNLVVAIRGPVNATEEPMVYMTQALVSPICIVRSRRMLSRFKKSYIWWDCHSTIPEV